MPFINGQTYRTVVNCNGSPLYFSYYIYQGNLLVLVGVVHNNWQTTNNARQELNSSHRDDLAQDSSVVPMLHSVFCDSYSTVLLWTSHNLAWVGDMTKKLLCIVDINGAISPTSQLLLVPRHCRDGRLVLLGPLTEGVYKLDPMMRSYHPPCRGRNKDLTFLTRGNSQ